MDIIEYKKLFLIFLEIHGIKEQFEEELTHFRLIKMVDYLEIYMPMNFISNAFSWNTKKQGWKYWHNIHLLWLEILEMK